MNKIQINNPEYLNSLSGEEFTRQTSSIANLNRLTELRKSLTRSLIEVHNQQMQSFWDGEDEGLEAFLNAVGIQDLSVHFSEFKAVGEALNSSAEILGISERADVRACREISVNQQSGEITLLPLPELTEELPPT